MTTSRALASLLAAALAAGCGGAHGVPGDAAGAGADGPATDGAPADAPGLGWDSVEPISNDGQVIVERVSYHSGGLRVYGRICRPAGAGTYPLVEYNHGGFQGLDVDPELANCQSVAKLGFVWLSSSYRGEDGSDGKIEVCLGEVDDAMRMLQIASAQPYANPARVLMWGGSHGGCITLRAVERGAPVKVAIDAFGPTDLAAVYTFWEQQIAAGSAMSSTYMQLRAVIDQAIGGPPSSFPDAYTARSPLAFAADLPASVPLLVTHGAADPLVPPQQSCELAAAAGLASYHVDASGQSTTTPPPGCEGVAVTWQATARPAAWPGSRYLVVYDGAGHELTSTAAMPEVQDIAQFAMVKL